MKRIRLYVPALVALALGLFPSAPSRAQQVPAKPETADYSLGTPEGQPLEAAVSQLMEQAGANDLTAPNVLFDENARGATVPVLALRNVSVVGALQLLAVSADCRVVPIIDEAGEGEVIGYRILGAPPRPAGPGGEAAWGAAFGGGGGAMEGAIIGEAFGAWISATPAGGAPAGGSGLGSDGAYSETGAAPAPGLAGSPGGRARVVGADSAGHPVETIVFTTPVPPSAGGVAAASSTAVYALGPVTGNMKLADIEQALQELLAMNEGGKESASLRIHEATSTLIVRGEAEVLALMRRERRRRALRHGAIGVAAACLILRLFLGNPAGTASDNLAAPAPPLPEVRAPVPPTVAVAARIPRLTAEEMLDFLGDAPVALVTRSDGSRALLMLTPAP